MFCSVTIVLDAGLLKVLNLNKMYCKTIKRCLILNKVQNCRNTWLKTENTPAQPTNYTPVFSASYHLLRTGMSEKTSQLGGYFRDHAIWHLPRHSHSATDNGWMGHVFTHPSCLNLHRHSLQSVPITTAPEASLCCPMLQDDNLQGKGEQRDRSNSILKSYIQG